MTLDSFAFSPVAASYTKCSASDTLSEADSNSPVLAWHLVHQTTLLCSHSDSNFQGVKGS